MSKLYWTVKIGVEECWIEDGFNLTQERLLDMIQSDLKYSYQCELSAKIISKPDKKVIAKLQGKKN